MLFDEVGPEAVSDYRLDSVQIEDGDEGTQQSGGPVVERLRVQAIEQFTAEILDARRRLMISHVVNDARGGTWRVYSQLAIFTFNWPYSNLAQFWHFRDGQ